MSYLAIVANTRIDTGGLHVDNFSAGDLKMSFLNMLNIPFVKQEFPNWEFRLDNESVSTKRGV